MCSSDLHSGIETFPNMDSLEGRYFGLGRFPFTYFTLKWKQMNAKYLCVGNPGMPTATSPALPMFSRWTSISVTNTPGEDGYARFPLEIAFDETLWHQDVWSINMTVQFTGGKKVSGTSATSNITMLRLMVFPAAAPSARHITLYPTIHQTMGANPAGLLYVPTYDYNDFLNGYTAGEVGTVNVMLDYVISPKTSNINENLPQDVDGIDTLVYVSPDDFMVVPEDLDAAIAVNSALTTDSGTVSALVMAAIILAVLVLCVAAYSNWSRLSSYMSRHVASSANGDR